LNQSKKIFVRPSQLVLIGDQLMIAFGFLSALFCYFRLLSINIFPIHTIVYRLCLHLTFGIIFWFVFRINKKVIRFFSSKDYLNLIFILFLIHLASDTSGLFFSKKHQLKVEILFISFLFTSFYIIGCRIIINYLYFYYRKSKVIGEQKRLIIYGAGELGVFLKKSINTHYQNEFKLIAFIDDDKNKIDRYIGGIKVISATKKLEQFIVKEKITDIIIANNAITASRKSQFLESILPLKVKLKEIASIETLFGNGFNLNKLSSIDINDLMNRTPIELYDEHVSNTVKTKCVLVTGAAGSIGSEIVRKLSEHQANLILCLDFSESALYDLEQELKRKHPSIQYSFILADIRNEQIMEEVFNKYSPSFVYHAAAYKHVPMMELYPWEAVQTNVFGTLNLVNLAIRFKTEKFVFISSDKAVNPTSIMGATKRLSEIIVQGHSFNQHKTSFVVTRFGNVLGSNGSVVPLFKKQIEHGGPVTVTHPEMVRYFMTIAEACQLVLEASVMANGGEIYVFDMGKPVKIVDLARNMIRLAGYVPDEQIKIEFVGERPGEKLYEEVFSLNEKLKETHHEKIMISEERIHDNNEIDEIISSLKSLENYYNPELFKLTIKKLLPEFKYSNGNENSVFETIANKRKDLKYQN
jgi:FlaA1/EpsC-like NDP-sugar epimerase